MKKAVIAFAILLGVSLIATASFGLAAGKDLLQQNGFNSVSGFIDRIQESGGANWNEAQTLIGQAQRDFELSDQQKLDFYLELGDITVQVSPDEKAHLEYQVYASTTRSNPFTTKFQSSQDGIEVGIENTENVRMGGNIRLEGTLSLPARRLKKLSLKTDLGKMSVSGLNVTDLSVKVSTGDLKLENMKVTNAMDAKVELGNCTMDEMEMKSADFKVSTGNLTMRTSTVSDLLKLKVDMGNCKIEDGSVNRGDLHVSTGNITVRGTKFIQSLTSDTSMGDTRIYLPAPYNFTLNYKVSIGDFKISLPDASLKSSQGITARNGSYVVGDGSCVMNVTVSTGSAKIDAA